MINQGTAIHNRPKIDDFHGNLRKMDQRLEQGQF